MEQWPSGKGADFQIQGSQVENHWVGPKSSQPFIFSRLIKWVLGTAGGLVVESKLFPRSGFVVLWQLNSIH